MFTRRFASAELERAWLEDDESARWRSTSGHGPESGAAASGSSLLEIAPGCVLPRHTDSAEETIVVVDGEAELTVGSESGRVGAGDVALVPEGVPHEVRNDGAQPLRFVAVYAGTDVVTTYERPVQPDGSPERQTVG
ncbi:MAG TPA: cupin domain-containing protein [Solirubrobacterales bacterium]|nr:cupin domain-containing protein [Solirubrobacterales bacterium]